MTTTILRQLLGLLLLLAAPLLQAMEVAGVRVDDSIRVGAGELVLNGAGVRSKLFLKVYVGALYAERRSPSAAPLLDAAGPRRMQLHFLRNLDAETFLKALDDGMQANHTAAELAELQPQNAQLAALMKAIGKVREGDTVAIDFTAEGVAIALNGEARGKVAGAPFAKALLKVWLGDNPSDASLKKALLGQ